jgi:hypothetical protein
MPQLTHDQYNLLERALARGERIVAYRRGTELVVVPLSLEVRGGREVIETRNPTTGDHISLFVDELDAIEAIA